MPPGFGILDAALVSVPIFLALLGLIRGAPVELASCVGCLAGVVAAWMVSTVPPIHDLGQPGAPLLAMLGGIVVWRLTRSISERLGLDTRWVDLGWIFDSAIGFAMGGIRGLAMVCAACLAYAMIFVPMGLANPLQTVAYPVFLAVGSQVTSAVIASTDGAAPNAAGNAAQLQTMATVPLPLIAPQIGPAAATPAAAAPSPGPSLASFVRIIAPPAMAAPTIFHPDIPVRQLPVSLIETHHNLLHPHGIAPHRPRR